MFGKTFCVSFREQSDGGGQLSNEDILHLLVVQGEQNQYYNIATPNLGPSFKINSRATIKQFNNVAETKLKASFILKVFILFPSNAFHDV